MLNRWFSGISNQDIAALLIFFVAVLAAIFAGISAIPSISTIWSANNLWLEIISIAILIFIFIIAFVAIRLYYKRLSRKAMIYRVISPTKIVDTTQPSSTVFKDLIVTFKNKPQTSLYLVLIELQNVGNTPIEISDFNGKDIFVGFGVEASILEASMKAPDGRITESIQQDRENIQVPKFESNPNDLHTIRVFLESDNYNIQIDPPNSYGFNLRRVDNGNDKNFKYLQYFLWSATLIPCFVSIATLITLIRTDINIWILLSFLAITSIVYVSFIISKLFIAIFLRQSKI